MRVMRILVLALVVTRNFSVFLVNVLLLLVYNTSTWWFDVSQIEALRSHPLVQAPIDCIRDISQNRVSP